MRRRNGLSPVGVLLALSVGSAASSQVEYTLVNVTCRPAVGGSNCIAADPCGGSTAELELGSYEFRVFSPDGASEVWFRLDWPDAWALVDSSACRGTRVSGDLTDPRAGLHIRDLACDFAATTVPILSFVLDCTEPGWLSLGGYPGHEFPEGADCRGVMTTPTYDRRIKIGDFCGEPATEACGYCNRSSAGYFRGRFQYSLLSGEVLADTIEVISREECEDIPECQGGPSPCYGGVGTLTEWIDLQPLDEVGSIRRFLLRLDSAGLTLGIHSGRVLLHGLSECCVSTCQDVTLEVRPVTPVIETTWGRVKFGR